MRRVLRPLASPLGSIQKEFWGGVVGCAILGDPRGIALGRILEVGKRLLQQGQQAMDSVIGLRLAYSKMESQQGL